MTIRRIDYSTRDYEGFREDLIAMLKEKMPEYTDFSQSDAGIVILELLAHGLDLLSYYNDVVANEVFLPTARERESVIKRAGAMGYTLGNATSAKFNQVFEIIPQTEEYVIPMGTRVSTKGDEIEPDVIYELDEDLIIPEGKTGLETDEDGEYLYTVTISQGETIATEILGSSNDLPDQKFKTGYKPVLEESLKVYVNEGAGSFRWDRVSGFLSSDQQSRHFTFSVNEQDESTIQFGNGLSGRIPTSFINGISATYKIGGGSTGNVAPMTITEMTSKPALVVKTFNPYSAKVTALDKESIESAKIKAPASLSTLNRAVTLEDFKNLALARKDIRKANAIKNESGGEHTFVDVCVLPQGMTELTEELRIDITEFYANRALLGVGYEILSPEYEEVNLKVTLETTSEYYNSTIKNKAKELLTEYFKIGNRDFGETVVISKLISFLVGIRGVESVEFELPTSNLSLSPYAIPVLSETFEVTVVGGKTQNEIP